MCCLVFFKKFFIAKANNLTSILGYQLLISIISIKGKKGPNIIKLKNTSMSPTFGY